jgi:hypothetical protein
MYLNLHTSVISGNISYVNFKKTKSVKNIHEILYMRKFKCDFKIILWAQYTLYFLFFQPQFGAAAE